MEKINVHSLASFSCRPYLQQMEIITIILSESINPFWVYQLPLSLFLIFLTRMYFPAFWNRPVFMYTNYQKPHSDSLHVVSS